MKGGNSFLVVATIALFSTEAEFAKNHRHLEDLGDIDAIAKKEVEMTIRQKSTIDQEGMKKIDEA